MTRLAITVVNINAYRTLRGQDQRKKCTLKFHEVHFRANSALLHRKECFNGTIKHSVCIKAQLPMCSSAG